MFLMTAAVNSEVVAAPESKVSPLLHIKELCIVQLTTHIGSSDFASIDHVEGRTRNVVGKVVEATQGNEVSTVGFFWKSKQFTRGVSTSWWH